MFFEEHAKRLQSFAHLSQTAGARCDYVQGGGGNTSVKLSGGLMAIKASGFCLKDITPERAYAVLDGAKIRDFYLSSEPSQFADVEKEGAAMVKSQVKQIEGLDTLRPSVEAGFHSILKTYVLHTHAVYANLACCAENCCEIAEKAFADAPYTWGVVDYTDPGANLTFAIRDEMARVRRETGKTPSVILMKNHGIIAHDDDPERTLQIHADANERLAAQFGLTGDSFPAVKIEARGDGLYAAATPYLKEAMQSGSFTEASLLEQPLYPDQMVFLIDTFWMDRDEIGEGQCVADSKTGEVIMRMDEKKAQVMAETLTAVTFIINHIKAQGFAVSTMGEAAKRFIANWESEKYRKSLAGKKA